jgi:ubiquinone/menaquinone biosynthesis C-methylase UbiE
MTQTIEKRSDDEVRRLVRDRYAEIARSGSPVPEAGCCGPSTREIAARIGYDSSDIEASPAGANLGLGCGAPLGHARPQPGETVLDLGSGAGFDAFLAARAVGESGRVIGVDMTQEMIDKATRNAAEAGVRNSDFRLGYIEDLPVDSDSVDLVISNCVINLAPDKAAVYREVARVLRPGGRVVVSDVVLDKQLPPFVAESVAALTGCVAGAALRADYLDTIRAAGLDNVEVLRDSGFGAMAMDMVPKDMLEQAQKAGIDVREVADGVRSLTIRAWKPRR